MGPETVTPDTEFQVQESFLDNLGLLLRNEAIYRTSSARIRELAEALAAGAGAANGRRTLTITLSDDGLEIGSSLHGPLGPRTEVATRLTGLNVRRVHFAPTVEPDDLVAFAGVVNREVGRITRARAVTASWAGLPTSVVLEESTFNQGLGDLDARLGLTPELDAVRGLLSPDRLEGFLSQLGDIRESMTAAGAGGVTRRVDVLEAVVDRLSEVDKESPERAEALIEEALVRFRSLLGALQEREVSPGFRGMVTDVAERFFPRVARDCREEPPEACGRRWSEEELPDSRSVIGPLCEQLDAFLTEEPPPIRFGDPVPDASYLHLLSRFLHQDRPVEELRAATQHVVALLDQDKLAGFETKLRKFIFARLPSLPDHTPLNPLLYRLVGVEEIAGMLQRYDLNDPEQVTRFADMARVVLPQAISGLFRFLESEDIDYQAGLLRRVLRAVGRDAILAAGADLRDSPIVKEEGFLPRLRRLRIPEVLPLVEVLYNARDTATRQAGFTLARAYPYRCRCAFLLQAATRPAEVASEYVHTVLGLEWEGVDDEVLYHRLLAEAREDATDPMRWELAIRSLEHANVDEAAETLVEICGARRWGVRPVHPQPVREAARGALGRMTCKIAIDWNL